MAAGLLLISLCGVALASSGCGDGSHAGPVVISAKAAEPTTYTADRSDAAETAQHIPYILGNQGFFHPDREITRAQIAQMLCNLNISKPGDVSFSDVAEDQWYAETVAQVSGLLTGYADGTFRPNAPATMGEFVTILCRALETELPELELSEEDPWYAASWIAAEDQGWFPEGYDGQGSDLVDRAMAVTMINRALGRTPDTERLDQVDEVFFVDVQPGHWAYYDILEAALDHRHNADGSWAEQDLNQQALKSGIYIDGSVAYYVEPSGALYRTPGILELDGKRYLVADETGKIWADNAIHPYENTLVCCSGTGRILQGGSYNGFYFDENGFYTSGSTEIDTYVNQVISECTDSTMTQLEKLRAVFDRVRSYGYLGRNATISSATMTAEQASAYALKIFETGKGDCYNFTAAFYYLARALGYDARTVVGTCRYSWNSTRAVSHAWVLISMDGGTYLFDPQIENYNLRSGISNETQGAFRVTYETAHAVYYPNK